MYAGIYTALSVCIRLCKCNIIHKFRYVQIFLQRGDLLYVHRNRKREYGMHGTIRKAHDAYMAKDVLMKTCNTNPMEI